MHFTCWDFNFELSFTKVIITGPDRSSAGAGFGLSVCSFTQQAGQSCCLHDFTQTLSCWPLQLGCAQLPHASLGEQPGSTCFCQDKAPPWDKLEVLSFPFKIFFPFYPCTLLLWLAHKMRGACHWLHSGECKSWGVPFCSLLPFALEQTGVKLGSHAQAPAAFRLWCSLLETAQKGQSDAGGLWVSDTEPLDSSSRKVPFENIPLPPRGGCWFLVVISHCCISAPDILSFVSLTFPGQEILS